MSLDLPPPEGELAALSAQLHQLLLDVIERDGAIGFDRYMQMALYQPGLGYYSAGAVKLGADGDFITASELGPLYATTVAQGLAPVLEKLERPDIVELGGGSGVFCRDLLQALHKHGALPARYRMVEPNASLRHAQTETVGGLAEQYGMIIEWLDQPPTEHWNGVLFANEVADALPVKRFRFNGVEAAVSEIVVDAQAGQLVLAERPAGAALQQAVLALAEHCVAWPIGFEGEWCPSLQPWVASVLSGLRHGVALFVDYGDAQGQHYHRQRSEGTLRCFYRHRVHGDALLWPGAQDLTASVDFTALAQALDAVGVTPSLYCTQAAFLLGCGIEAAFENAYASAEQPYAVAQQARSLLTPGQMGDVFKVLAATVGGLSTDFGAHVEDNHLAAL
ncbi:MAG: hypothetical protein DHS20C11_21900 [Lysobacteraceae bacterium]|nr:MAG: hypothetical protein DHS20C11_21900 [Xanthomonadaceae bacterium]